MIAPPPTAPLNAAEITTVALLEDDRDDQGTDNIRVLIHAKDSDQYNFAKWRDAQARDSWARARERGNVVSVTVLRASAKSLKRVL